MLAATLEPMKKKNRWPMKLLPFVLSVFLIQSFTMQAHASASQCHSAHRELGLQDILNGKAPRLETSIASFHAKNEQLAKSEAELEARISDVRKDIASLQVQLSPAEKKVRRLQDPRIFASRGLRRDSTNQYTKSLNMSLEWQVGLEKKLSAILAQVVDVKKLKKLEYSNLSTSDKAIYLWLMNRLNSLFSTLVEAQTHPHNELKSQAEYLKYDYQRFFSSLEESSNSRSQLLLQAQSELKNQQMLPPDFQLKNDFRVQASGEFKARLAEKVALSTEDATALETLYQEIHSSFSMRDEENNWASIMHPSYVLHLTTQAHKMGIPASKVISVSKDFYMTARHLFDNYSIRMTAVTMMIPLSLKKGLPPHFVLSRLEDFLELVHSQRYESWKLGHSDLAQMTTLSFETGKSAADILERYDQVLLYGKNARIFQGYDELSSIELVGLSIRQNRSVKAVMDDYEKVLTSLLTRTPAWRSSDISVVRVLQIAERMKLPLSQVLNLANSVQEMIPDIHPTQVVGLMEQVLSAKAELKKGFPKIGPLLTEEEMSLAKVYLWDHGVISDSEWLYREYEKTHTPLTFRNSTTYEENTAADSSEPSKSDNTVSMVQLEQTGSIINLDGSRFTPR